MEQILNELLEKEHLEVMKNNKMLRYSVRKTAWESTYNQLVYLLSLCLIALITGGINPLTFNVKGFTAVETIAYALFWSAISGAVFTIGIALYIVWDINREMRRSIWTQKM